MAWGVLEKMQGIPGQGARRSGPVLVKPFQPRFPASQAQQLCSLCL